MPRLSQELRLKNLFESREGEWVGLPEILDLRIAQYGRAIYHLRHDKRYGPMNIQNKTQVIDGTIYSWFGLNIKDKQLELYA